MTNTHSGQPVLRSGDPLENSRLAVILLHGRGGTADDILGLAHAFALDGITYLAPQARNGSWYPNSFLAPIEDNEPWLSSAIATVGQTLELCKSAALSQGAIAVCGFSQGACLSTEFVARNPHRYAGLIAFTGGLIGPPGISLRHEGSLDGTPALLSSGDPDPHVPWERVVSSGEELERMGGTVELLRHPGRPHTILKGEIEAARALLVRARDAAPLRRSSGAEVVR